MPVRLGGAALGRQPAARGGSSAPGAGVLAVPLPGVPAAGAGEAPGGPTGRWSGAAVKRLGSACGAAPPRRHLGRSVFPARAAGPARGAAGALLGRARASSGCSAGPAPRALPAGRAATRPPASPSRCLSGLQRCRVHGTAGIGASGKPLQVNTCRPEHP